MMALQTSLQMTGLGPNHAGARQGLYAWAGRETSIVYLGEGLSQALSRAGFIPGSEVMRASSGLAHICE